MPDNILRTTGTGLSRASIPALPRERTPVAATCFALAIESSHREAQMSYQRRTTVTIKIAGCLLLLLGLPLFAKDDLNPADYAETAVVTAARIVTVDTGVTIKRNPACDNPQTPFMKGYCGQAGTRVRSTSQKYVEVMATIKNNNYTLNGNKLPPPGIYKARFLDNGEIELMGPNAKGEIHAHKFTAVAIEAASEEKPAK